MAFNWPIKCAVESAAGLYSNDHEQLAEEQNLLNFAVLTAKMANLNEQDDLTAAAAQLYAVLIDLVEVFQRKVERWMAGANCMMLWIPRVLRYQFYWKGGPPGDRLLIR